MDRIAVSQPFDTSEHGATPGQVPAASNPDLGVADGRGRFGGRRRLYAVLAALVLAAIVIVPSLIHVPYVIFKPGTATNTLGNLGNGQAVIDVSDAASYQTSGTLDFMTVAVYGGPQYPVNVWEYLEAKLDSHATIYPERDFFPPGATTQQVNQEDQAEMAGAQQAAIVVALRATGRKVPETLVISNVDQDAPAASVLRPGDVLLAVGGHRATSFAAVLQAVGASKPGASLAVQVRRAGKTLTVHTTTHKQGSNTVIGVELRENFAFPVKITVRAGDVGGPSAGLMFSLGIYDKLTPGALTGGVKWAGTGTIDPTGAVGKIGGIQQKMVAARNAGASHFLAPAGDCNEVVGHIPDGLQVVKVSTFQQAKTYVQEAGAGKKPALPTCS